MSNSACRLSILLLWICATPVQAMDWVVHASRPGPDSAAVGQSRFDQLYLQTDGSYRIPYPFDYLIEDLEARLDNDGEPGVRQTFVPRGRSLQRDTPAPEYFRYPRRVIAVEGEAVVNELEAGLVMEYRLFIAHQPKTQTLEVISYNDDAGRFEFQLVENYNGGDTTRVTAANRLMCMSCHHNAAPIFPRIPWRETSANVEIATRLAGALPERFDSMIEVLSLDAGVIDVLSERANYLSAAQTVWQQGCSSTACRAQMLLAALQFRLSDEASFDWNSARFRQVYFDELSRNWASRWPAGLALPASRLSDRDPFGANAAAIEHDPLRARPPQAVWHGVDATLARGIVYRLAGFFTRADIERLDRRLRELGRLSPANGYRYTAACRTSGHEVGLRQLKCGEQSARDSLQAEIEIELVAGKPVSLRFLTLRIPGDSNLLQPWVRAISVFPDRLEIDAAHRSGLSQRLANGDRLATAVLRWMDGTADGASVLEIDFSAESRILVDALEKLSASASDSLAAGVFRRRAVLQDVMPLLGMRDLEWPAAPGRRLAQPVNQENSAPGGALALLQPYCAPCHADNRRQPPGFLAGKDILAKLSHCAPRMLQRLRAWQPGSGYTHSPMPPPVSIAVSGVDAATWPQSDHYRKLLESLEKLLPPAGRDQWKTLAYADLPACLPPSAE